MGCLYANYRNAPLGWAAAPTPLVALDVRQMGLSGTHMRSAATPCGTAGAESAPCHRVGAQMGARAEGGRVLEPGRQVESQAALLACHVALGKCCNHSVPQILTCKKCLPIEIGEISYRHSNFSLIVVIYFAAFKPVRLFCSLTDIF